MYSAGAAISDEGHILLTSRSSGRPTWLTSFGPRYWTSASDGTYGYIIDSGVSAISMAPSGTSVVVDWMLPADDPGAKGPSEARMALAASKAAEETLAAMVAAARATYIHWNPAIAMPKVTEDITVGVAWAMDAYTSLIQDARASASAEKVAERDWSAAAEHAYAMGGDPVANAAETAARMAWQAAKAHATNEAFRAAEIADKARQVEKSALAALAASFATANAASVSAAKNLASIKKADAASAAANARISPPDHAAFAAAVAEDARASEAASAAVAEASEECACPPEAVRSAFETVVSSLIGLHDTGHTPQFQLMEVQTVLEEIIAESPGWAVASARAAVMSARAAAPPAPSSIFSYPVGSVARGFVDSQVCFGRSLGGGNYQLVGNRMQHVFLRDNGTHDVRSFHNFATLPAAFAVSRDGTAVVGTGGGGVLVWSAERLAASLPEPHRGYVGQPDPKLTETLHEGGVLGMASLHNGLVAAGHRRGLLFWDPRHERLTKADLVTGPNTPRVVNVCASGANQDVAVLRSDGTLTVYDTAASKERYVDSHVIDVQADARGNSILRKKDVCAYFNPDAHVHSGNSEIICDYVRTSHNCEHLLVKSSDSSIHSYKKTAGGGWAKDRTV